MGQIRLVLVGEGSVAISFGDSEALVVETDDNLIGLIETTVRDGVLDLHTAVGVDIAPTHSVKYRVTATDLVAVTLAGAGSIEVESWTSPGWSSPERGRTQDLDDLASRRLVLSIP